VFIDTNSSCRLGLVWLTAATVVLQSGCATVAVPPAVPSQAMRDSFGVVAIVPAQYAPQSEVAIGWRHKEGATAKVAALMVGGGLAVTAYFAAGNPPLPPPIIVLIGVTGTAAAAIPEAIGTSKGIVPESLVLDIESAIGKVVSSMDVQSVFAGQLATMLKSDPRIRLATAGIAGPDHPAARPDYKQLHDAGIDTVIEVAIAEIGFDGCILNNWECRPPHTLHLSMRGLARLVRVADGITLFEWPLDYNSGPHELKKWLADGGRLLSEELELANRELAERVYDEAYLITPIALPLNDKQGAQCWLEPLFPKSRGYRTDTLQPTLRWSAFPREIDRQQLDPAVLQKISDVTYDLRIWDEDADQNSKSRHLNQRWRNRMIYERKGLAIAQHTLESPLPRASRYYWSVRARFVVDGRPMVTRWMRVSRCFSYDLSPGYYEFYTPK